MDMLGIIKIRETTKEIGVGNKSASVHEKPENKEKNQNSALDALPLK